MSWNMKSYMMNEKEAVTDYYYSSRDILSKAIGTDAYFRIKSILMELETAAVAQVRRGTPGRTPDQQKEECRSMNVLIVSVPVVDPGTDIKTLRDFIADSLKLGVLVLGQGVKWEVAELPELGGILPTLEEGIEAEALPPGEEGRPSFSGPGSREKRRIYEVLNQYRERNGLGSFHPLADLCGPPITETLLREMFGGAKVPIEIWRQVGNALDRLQEVVPDGEAD